MELLPISNHFGNGVVSTQGAQLLTWSPNNGESLLWCTEAKNIKQGVPIRGGIPICWPWFGKYRNPAHGFARTSIWTLVKNESSRLGTELEFILQDSPVSRALWPFAFEARIKMTLGVSARIIFTTAFTEGAAGYNDEEKRMTAALHSYLRIGDIEKAKVSGLGKRYLDMVNSGQDSLAANPTRFSTAFDRIYHQPDCYTFLQDAGLGRSISLWHQGHSDVVAWNPWQEGASTMADIGKDEWRRFICLETARVSQPFVGALGLEIVAD